MAEKSKDYKQGAKLGRGITEVLEQFLEQISAIAASRKKAVWDDKNPFSRDLEDITHRLQHSLASLEKKASDLKVTDVNDAMRGMKEEIAKVEGRKVENWEEVIKGLETNFEHYNVNSSPHKKDISYPASVDTQKELFVHLLRNNRGLALGDLHTQDETMRHLVSNMDVCKRMGVDTIYIEFPKKPFERFRTATISELKEYANTKDWKAHSKEMSSFYDVINVDSGHHTVEMFIAAKKASIEIKNVDKRDLGEEISRAVPELRTSCTNFEWTHNIESDRKGKTGKFLVFAGAFHFANEAGPGNGLVDDALGIPHLAFGRSKHESQKFHKGNGGIDFLLDGGPDCYAKATNGATANVDTGLETNAISPKEVKTVSLGRAK